MKAASFLGSILLLGLHDAAYAAQCNADNCLRAAIGTAKGLHSVRLASCTSFAQCSVTPTPNYVYSPSATPVASPDKRSTEITNCPSDVPATASACNGPDRYSSACACGGVGMTYNTVPASAPTPIPAPYFILRVEQGGGYAGGFAGLAYRPVTDNFLSIAGPSDFPAAAEIRSLDGPNRPLGLGDDTNYGAYQSPYATSGDFLYDGARPSGFGPYSPISCSRNDTDGTGSKVYLQCVGVKPAFTQFYVCDPTDDNNGFPGIYLGDPNQTHPSCYPASLRIFVKPTPYSF